jgi:hypothetical protein
MNRRSKWGVARRADGVDLDLGPYRIVVASGYPKGLLHGRTGAGRWVMLGGYVFELYRPGRVRTKVVPGRWDHRAL